MLTVMVAEQVGPLVDQLAGRLASAGPDPFAREWVAVSTVGMRRWLLLELAGRLGTAEPGRGDGVAANIATPLAGSLVETVLAAGRPGGADPWGIETLVWAVLADPVLPRTPPGGSRYALARRIADLFDRYHVHRPAMIRAWAAGRDVDGLGAQLGAHQRWQPALWRGVRGRLGEPSPPERAPEVLEQLAGGQLALDLPPRVSAFGMTGLPGGESFLEVVQALGAVRQVDVYLLEPSGTGARRIAEAWARRSVRPWGGLRRPLSQSEEETAEALAHPLLAAWGRAWRETVVLLAEAEGRGLGAPVRVSARPPGQPLGSGSRSLLRAIQEDLRADRAPRGDLALKEGDRSVQIHACHGASRQVEVLRDALWHLLADPTLGLEEDDVVVVCPDLGRFAPLLEAIFGEPAAPGRAGPASGGPPGGAPPALRYVIAERPATEENPLLVAVLALVELLGGRFDASRVLEFLSLGPVRTCLDLREGDLGLIADWVAATKVRWGLDPSHRARWGLPEAIEANTWEAGLDRLLAGVAVTGDPAWAVMGGTAPFEVEGDEAEVAGKLARALGELKVLCEEAARPHTPAEWVEMVAGAAARFMAPAGGEDGPLAELDALLAPLRSGPLAAGVPEVEVDLVDLRRMLGDQLERGGARSNYFRGGITVTSEKALRGIPFKVVALIGMDHAVGEAERADADDLAGAAPLLGDRSPQADLKEAMLEALLAAGDHVLVFRDGFDVRTNRPIPAAAMVEDLRDVAIQTVRPADRARCRARLETSHPRHGFDERCLVPGAIREGVVWSFDPGALWAARARRSQSRGSAPRFLRAPLGGPELGVVELSDLQRFVADPVRTFLVDRLGAALPGRSEEPEVVLPVSLAGLARFEVGERLLRARLSGRSVAEVAAAERRLGTLPPGILGEAAMGEIAGEVEELVVAYTGRLGLRRDALEPVEVDVRLADGTRVVGSVGCHQDEGWRGPAEVRFSRYKPADRLACWLDLVALAASHPESSWRALRVHRGEPNRKPVVVDLVTVDGSPKGSGPAHHALEVAVDCYRRGMSEPVPLFPQVAEAAYRGKRAPERWSSRWVNGDGDTPAAQLVFSGWEYDDVVGWPAEPGDPPGPGGRLARFAGYLWGALEESVRDAPPPQKTRAGESR